MFRHYEASKFSQQEVLFMQRKAKAVGINHVAIEVDDIGAALILYSQFFDFEITRQEEDIAII